MSFPLLLHLNGLYSRLIYRRFIRLMGFIIIIIIVIISIKIVHEVHRKR